MNRTVRNILSAALLIVFVVSSLCFLTRWFDRQSSAQSYNYAAELAEGSVRISESTQPVQTEPPATTSPETEPPAQTEPPRMVWVPEPVEEDEHMQKLAEIDLAALQQVNPDVLGWISIPNSRIHYPITQGEDNSYYLDHTWEKRSNAGGAIFLECQNDPELTDFNTIIYGHNMADGSMFADLHRYAHQSYWESHPYVYIVTVDGVLRYEIFSCYYAEVISPVYGLSFRQEKTRQELLDSALENSVLDTGVTPSVNDRILTLSTCSGGGYSSRRVVLARLKMVETEQTK